MPENESVGGVQLEAELDTSKLEKGIKSVKGQLESLDPSLKKTEDGMKKVEKSSTNAATAMHEASFASRALSTALGFLGVTTLDAILHKLIDFGKELFTVTLNLQAVESQARAVFGEAFPQMQKQADLLGKSFGRSSSDVLHFMAGFGDFLDQLGVAPEQTRKASSALAEMTLQYGKLKQNIPDEQIFDALQAGLAGNYKALRQLDILIKDDTLQQFANGLAIKNKVKDMDSEQKAILTTLYLQDDLLHKQNELANSTGTLGDEAKSASQAWQDFKEDFGTTISPLVAESLREMTELLGSFHAVLQLFAKGTETGTKTNGMLGLKPLPVTKDWTGGATHTVDPNANADSLSILNKKPRTAGGGGGDERKKAFDDLSKAQDTYIKALSEEAKMNLDNLDIRKKELEIRRDLGLATGKELTELERINRRVDYQKSAVDDATKAWEKQKGIVEGLKQEVDDLQKKVTDFAKGEGDIFNTLQDRLADIDKSQAEKRKEKVAELVKELNDLQQKRIEGSGSLSGDDSKRLGEIQDQLAGATSAELQTGANDANLTDLQKIDQDAAQQRLEARNQADKDLADIRRDLTDKTNELNAAQAQLSTASDAVVAALERQRAATDTNMTAIETRTKAHVSAQIEQINRLRAAYEGLYGPGSSSAALQQAANEVGGVARFADGGMVKGPGSDRSDNLLVAVSPGERIISAATNRMYNPILEMIHNRSFPLQRFADGGVVNNDNHSRSATIHNHYHGASGRRMGSDDMMGYYVRRAMR